VFQCHQDRKKPADRRGMCLGWVSDQKRRGVPSMQLRLHLICNPEATAQFKALDPDAVELYPSVVEMCIANGVEP